SGDWSSDVCSSDLIGQDGLANALGEGGLIGVDHLLLDGEDFAVAIRSSPRPRLPLNLDAGKAVGLESIGDEVQSGLSIAGACERADLRTLHGACRLLLTGEALAGPLELFVFRSRAEAVERPPRLGDRVVEGRQRQ